MKKFKKIFAVLLTLAMVLGMSMTTFAATNSIISISGTGIDASTTIKYGQIIKENRESTLGWQFASNNIATDFVNGWNSAKAEGADDLDANGVIAAMIAAEMIENPANAHVTAGTINPSAQLSAALAAVKDAATETMANMSANVSETGKGLYIITASKTGYSFIPMAAYMDSKGTDVAVTAKGSEDQVNKTVAGSGKSVAPGDDVVYTITEQYLYIAPNAENKTFTITDTLTNGTLKSVDSIRLYNTAAAAEEDTALTGGISLTQDTDYTITSSSNTFTVDFGAKYNSNYAGKTVKITYTATAGAVTSTEPLSNKVSSSNGTGKIVEVKPVSFKVIKEDEKTQAKLFGAKFQIYKEAKESDAGAVELTLNDGSKVYGITVGTEIETNTKGEATVNNLDAQAIYYVKETEAPNGYSLNETAYRLAGADAQEDTTSTKEEGGITYTTITHNFDDFNDQTVKDTTLSGLPSTGGIGTTIFTIGGCAIMIIAAALFFASRRKSSK